jgi:allantoicase
MSDAALPAFTDLVDLAAARTGGVALAASDEFFAPKENLLKPGRGVFLPDEYTENGKWMDGWETRRKRTPGHDWCIVKLGLPGVIRGVDVDTNHFTGNFPEHCALDACAADGRLTVEALLQGGVEWTELLPVSRLEGGARNLFPIAGEQRFTHVRLRIYPDGGVARLRVHGEVRPDWEQVLAAGDLVDLAAVENGGFVPLASDMYFGRRENLIMPGRAANMGDGWETRRRRGPGHDWAIVRLGRPGTIRRVEVDTNHFKGNFPESCSLEAARIPGAPPAEFLASRSIAWETLLPRTRLAAHTRHFFEEAELAALGPVTHVRLNIFPDGGVSRLRLYGEVER